MIRRNLVRTVFAITAIASMSTLARAGDSCGSCCWDPCIAYRYCCRSCGCECKPTVKSELTVKDCCCDCSAKVPVCIPDCCKDETPTKSCCCDRLGRAVTTYTYKCGFIVDVTIRRNGNLIVTYSS